MKSPLIDRELWKYLLLFYGVAFVLSSTSGLLAKWEGIAYKTFGWWDLIVNTILRYSAKFAFIMLAILLIRYLYRKSFISEWSRVLLHGLFAVGLTFYSVYSQVLLNNWFYGLEDPLSWDYVYTRALLGTDYNFFLYFSMAAIVYAYYYFKKEKDFEVKESQLTTQLLDAKLSALQSQLQPHFLFNTLNDISSLVDKSPEKAQDSIADLCDLLRETLQLSTTKYISLKQELGLLQKYLAIEKVRFDEKLRFRIDVSEELLNEKIPPLLLQPILENAINYGFSYQHDVLAITIRITKRDKDICLHISNDGQPLEGTKITFGIGLSNVMNRLETLYPGAYQFNMNNLPNESGVETIIIIPSAS